MNIPIFIKKKIMIFSIKYPFQDICILIMNILCNFYNKKLENYYPPYQLSFCRARCCICNKTIFNECYSEIIDLNYGWIHCYECKELIQIWSSNYFEYNNKFPLDYVSNINTDELIFFKSKDNKKKKGYINIFCKYLNMINNQIYIAIIWNKNGKNLMEWILLKDIFKIIYLIHPPYFSLEKYHYWHSKINNIKI